MHIARAAVTAAVACLMTAAVARLMSAAALSVEVRRERVSLVSGT
jgi:hypothetical protein